MGRIWAICALTGVVVILPAPAQDCAQTPRQYLVFNLIPEEPYRSAFEEIQLLKPRGREGGIGLGIGAIFSYLDVPRGRCIAEIKEFLSLSVEYDIPVIVQLDGEQWWRNRPDLWNWWDATKPGYAPQNRLNVEWDGWGPAHALRIAWRNWGRQIRVLPPPNLSSPRYREACHEEMQVLVPLIVKWWNDLPANKKDLLIGVKIGWESAIGVNSFYYPGGNVLLECPESEDPSLAVNGEQVPDRGMKVIGYAAVATTGLAYAGEIREEHLVGIIEHHLEDLCGLASALGIPRDRMFTHIGGWKNEELLYDAALNRYCCPGWSFYRYAYDPLSDEGVRRVRRKSDAPWWAAVEWMLLETNDADAWRSAMWCALSDPACRYMCIYNWSGIKDLRGPMDAVMGVLRGHP